MADNIEHQDKGELVANCDQLQNDEVIVTTPVESRIMSIRGKQIMIDRDLAELYGVETRVLNQAVKRNMERFPERFRFQLTKEEMNELVTNCDRFNSLKHSTVRSYAFTEQGVAMLSTVLRSETAIRISIRIMDAFVAMRRFMVTNAEVFQRLSTMKYHQLEMQQHLQESDKRIEDHFLWKKSGVEYLEKAIDLSIPKDSNMTRLYIGMTDCYKMAEMPKEQIESIRERYRKYDKQNHKLLYDMAFIYFYSLKDKKNTERCLETFLKTRPKEEKEEEAKLNEKGELVLDTKNYYNAAANWLKDIQSKQKIEDFFLGGNVPAKKME